jgi:tetratricopeptide (TPR) repeat protein
MQMAREGLTLAEEDDDRFGFQLELEKLLEREPDREAHAEALAELLRLGESTGDPRRQGQALVRKARSLLFHGAPTEAEAAAAQALEHFRFDDDPAAQARTLRLLGLARFERRDLEGALDALTRAEEAAEGHTRTLGLIEHQLGMLRLETGDAPRALEHLLTSLRLCLDDGDLAAEGACLDAIAEVYSRAGRSHTALDLLDRAIALRRRIGDEEGRAQSCRNRAEVALHLGDTDAAEHEAAVARQLSRSLGLERIEHSATLVAARAALLREEPKDAEPLIENVRRRTSGDEYPYGSMEAALLSAWAKWQRAQQAKGGARQRLLTTALRRAKEATELGEKHGYALGQVLGMALTGEVMAAGGDAAGALIYSQRAAELYEERGRTSLPVEMILGAHARVLIALGDDDEAAVVLQRACDELARRAQHLPADVAERFWSPPQRALVQDEARRAAASS